MSVNAAEPSCEPGTDDHEAVSGSVVASARVTVTVYVFLVPPSAAVTVTVTVLRPTASATDREPLAVLPAPSAMTRLAPASVVAAVTVVRDTSYGTAAE